MARLIEVQQGEGAPSPLAVRVGDLLLIRASGGWVRDGASVVELLGSFVPAVVADTGAVLAPAGPPGVVLVRARAPGAATLELAVGDPWHAPRTTALGLTVEP
jgi:hypothetical protein